MTLVKYNRTPSVFNSFFDRFFNDDLLETRGNSSSFSPKVDIAETEKHFEIQFTLPGVEKKDINIDLTDDRLTVSGERRFDNEKKEKNYHAVESYYGKFSRSFYLPDNINAEKVDANYKDGILTLTLPKDAKKETKRTISIK